MSDLQKLTKIIREVVREEIEYANKKMINEIQSNLSQNNAQNIREEYVAPKMFNQFTQPSVQRKPEVVKPTGMGSLLQQMANEKISHPDDEFLAQRIR